MLPIQSTNGCVFWLPDNEGDIKEIYVPGEILKNIFIFHSLQHLMKISKTCRAWRVFSLRRIFELCCQREGIQNEQRRETDYRKAYLDYINARPSLIQDFTLARVTIFDFAKRVEKVIPNGLDFYENQLLWSYADHRVGTAKLHQDQKGIAISSQRHIPMPSCMHDVRISKKYLFLGSKEGVVKAFERHDTKEIHTFVQDSPEELHSLELKEKFLFAIFKNGTICIWDAENFLPIASLKEKKDQVHAFHFRGDRIAIAGPISTDCSSVTVWDFQLNQKYSLSLKDENFLTLTLFGEKLFIGTDTGRIFSWDFYTSECKVLYQGKKLKVLFIHVGEEGLSAGFSNGKIEHIPFELVSSFFPKPQLFFFFKNFKGEFVGGHVGPGKLNFNQLETKKSASRSSLFLHISKIEMCSEKGEILDNLQAEGFFTSLLFEKKIILGTSNSGKIILWEAASSHMSDLIRKTSELASNSPKLSFRQSRTNAKINEPKNFKFL